MDYNQTLHVITDGNVPARVSRELSYAAAGMVADSEYAQLSDASKEWAAKKMGFKSAEDLRAHCERMLDTGKHRRSFGAASMAEGIEYQVTSLHTRAVALVNGPFNYSNKPQSA